MKTDQDRFLVSKRLLTTPFQLAKDRQATTLVRSWYEPLTPFTQTVALGLFALTNDDPNEWQEVTAGDLLEVLDVAKYLKRDDRMAEGTIEVFNPQHYRDAFESLVRLANVSVPMKTVTYRKIGRQSVREIRLDYVRMVDAFGVAYIDRATGRPFSVDDSPDFESSRVDISGRYASGTRKKDRVGDRANPVWALAKVDKATGAIMTDDIGNPIIRPPDRYRFRWSREIVADLLHPYPNKKVPEGHGWLKITKQIFGVLRKVRQNPTAVRLTLLIAGDLSGKGPTSQRLDKAAKKIFVALGFPEPGDLRQRKLDLKDGRWSENVDRLKGAVQLVVDAGLLLPGSDLTPYEDPNPDRRKAPYYRWTRSEDFTFGTFFADPEDVDILDDPTVHGENRKPHVVQAGLFGPDPVDLHGRDIRAAREDAGLTIRDFAKRFGGSIFSWSQIEREAVSKRTGRPILVHSNKVEAVKAFVDAHLKKKEAASS